MLHQFQFILYSESYTQEWLDKMLSFSAVVFCYQAFFTSGLRVRGGLELKLKLKLNSKLELGLELELEFEFGLGLGLGLGLRLG